VTVVTDKTPTQMHMHMTPHLRLHGHMVTRYLYIIYNVLKYIYIIEGRGCDFFVTFGVTMKKQRHVSLSRPTTPSSINAKACFFARGAGAGAFSYVHTGRVKKPISSDPRAAFVAVASQVAG
jgi:hypothetical protein